MISQDAMQHRPFQQVDVFTAAPYKGNPLAVVLSADGLDTDAMQRFTHWTNLSEAAFVMAPTPEGLAAGADYRVRIFTPQTEYPFAGHPTLGACHAWLQAGGQPRQDGHVVQECGVGLVKLQHNGHRLAFAAPPSRRIAPAPAQWARVAQALGLRSESIRAAQVLDNGPVFMTLLLPTRQDVLACTPDLQALAALKTCAALASVEPGHVEVRTFGPHEGFDEDPVTGSLNAALAQWLIGEGIAPVAYVATQGTCLGRHGQVHVHRDADGVIWGGGESVTCVDGRVLL